ncbi:MAG TPA: TonB-dependent receptor, partial [Anaeromyxobacteraceae bacterium]|nr:TonB-dependent receptor [Anaeromyxobacteraceae bacterium]
IHELGPWSASLFLRYFGPRPLVEDDSVRSSGSALLNAQVSYRVNRYVKLTADVFNLANAQVDDISYYYASRLPNEPRTVLDPVTGQQVKSPGTNDIHFHPAEKRSVRGTVTVEF